MKTALALACVLYLSLALWAQDPTAGESVNEPQRAAGVVEELPSVEEFAKGKRFYPGFMTIYVDPEQARVWMAIPAYIGELQRTLFTCLYIEGLSTGLGSNPVGLDRGQLGSTRVVRFQRFGRRMLMVEPNQDFRAVTNDADEARATRDSFATSVLWSGEIVAENPGEQVVVEITSLVVSDAHGVARTLKGAGQGSWSLDEDRSAFDDKATRVLPKNIELEALLTFKSEKPGGEVRGVTPTAEAVSLRQHHSFVQLPDIGYDLRKYDPRMGHMGVSFLDFAAPLDAPLETRYAARHRLQHKFPDDPAMGVVEPIVYFVDRGAPKLIQKALIEGASWWSEAFAAAGFPDGFRVELLPERIDPMDVRYNVIQWVHRETRGWSYGASVRDPRTGEIIKGHVSLGSQRVRQDRTIFEGLVGLNGEGEVNGITPLELSMARLRQLAAHEVGHTLGLMHNFSASTMGRNSVMDYPAPELQANAFGSLIADHAYGVGIGAWDKLAICYLYSEFGSDVDEETALAGIAEESLGEDYRYHSDADARSPGAAMPYANLWDTGVSPDVALGEALLVRSSAIARFGLPNLAPGLPRAELADVFAPLYFYHRYQLEAAAKLLGGVDYQHGVAGDSARAMSRIEGARQRGALGVILRALDPSALDLSDELLEQFVPYAPGDTGSVERFGSRTAPLFDLFAAAETATRLVTSGLLQRERCARLVAQHAADEALPGLEEIMDALIAAALRSDPNWTARQIEINHGSQRVVVEALMGLASDPLAAPVVRERAEWRLEQLASDDLPKWEPYAPAHFHALTRRIERFLNRTEETAPLPLGTPTAPPGSPIGSGPGECGFEWTR